MQTGLSNLNRASEHRFTTGVSDSVSLRWGPRTGTLNKCSVTLTQVDKA